MGVPGIIVARTDAEAANLLESCSDERDQPFILGVTNLDVPSYKAAFLAVIRRLHDAGVEELNGHLLYAIAPRSSSRGRRVARALRHRDAIADEAAKAFVAGDGKHGRGTSSTGVADAFLRRGRPRPA